MDAAVTVLSHSMIIDDIPRHQILRYAGMMAGKTDDSVEGLIDKCYPTMIEAMKFKSCYLEVPVSIDGDYVSFEYLGVHSRNLCSVLAGCSKAILVVATAGMQADMIVKRAEVTSKAEALIMNSIAVAGIEKYMACFNEFIKEQYEDYSLRPRFSPGYGDVPLSMQTELLSVLDSKRKIGVALSDTLLMTPSKSVSAIIGLGEEGCIHIDRDCDLCSKFDCEYRLS